MSALVTLATDQTIARAKIFDGAIRMRDIVRVRPSASGGIASIEFFHNPDKFLYEAGDLWRVGMSPEPINVSNFMISTNLSHGGGPILQFTPLGVLSLDPGCVIDAPTIRQNNVLLNDLYQAKGDMSSYYNKTSIDNMLLYYVKRSGDQSASGNKTFTGLTRSLTRPAIYGA